jgi:hypothetical protein
MWKDILKADTEEEEREGLEFKVEKIIEEWLESNFDYSNLEWLDGQSEDVNRIDELVVDIEFENNSEDGLENEEAYEAGEGFFILQFRTETGQRNIARYNMIHDTGLDTIEGVELSNIPIEIARKLLPDKRYERLNR